MRGKNAECACQRQVPGFQSQSFVVFGGGVPLTHPLGYSGWRQRLGKTSHQSIAPQQP
ncbi:hypothetical protein BDW72DRAFT_177223 [Aspergillus terricola var. indicus]